MILLSSLWGCIFRYPERLDRNLTYIPGSSFSCQYPHAPSSFLFKASFSFSEGDLYRMAPWLISFAVDPCRDTEGGNPSELLTPLQISASHSLMWLDSKCWRIFFNLTTFHQYNCFHHQPSSTLIGTAFIIVWTDDHWRYYANKFLNSDS